MTTETAALILLTGRDYDGYNEILPVIKAKLGAKAGLFEQILSEELPLTTARRAYRTAIKIASGEVDVYRAFPPDTMGRKKFTQKAVPGQ